MGMLLTVSGCKKQLLAHHAGARMGGAKEMCTGVLPSFPQFCLQTELAPISTRKEDGREGRVVNNRQTSGQANWGVVAGAQLDDTLGSAPSTSQPSLKNQEGRRDRRVLTAVPNRLGRHYWEGMGVGGQMQMDKQQSRGGLQARRNCV